MKITTPIFLAFFAVLFLANCGPSIKTLKETGDYDGAIDRAMNRLVGKGKKNPRYVADLAASFNRANAADLDRAKRMISGGTTLWTRVHSIYASIDRRQQKVRPLVPLVDKNGKEARLNFVNVVPLLNEAADEAAAQLYEEGSRLLDRGRRGNKEAARGAWDAFESIGNYSINYKDTQRLQREAAELGTLYITVEMKNESGAFLPRGFNERLLAIQASAMDDRWRVFDANRQAGRDYDYIARIAIRDIQVSPERAQERQYIDEEEIEDGEEYVLDANGNVAKDSLGNDITRPRVVIVRANVIEVYQSKSAIVSGSFELYDLRERRVVDQDALTAEAIFENYASTFDGDRRALSADSRRRIGNQPARFPTNEQMILDAADALMPILQEQLASSWRLI